MVPGNALIGNLTRGEVSSRSSELVESFRSRMEESDIDAPAMSPLENTIFESTQCGKASKSFISQSI